MPRPRVAWGALGPCKSSLGDIGSILSYKMEVTWTSTAGLMNQWMETKCGFKSNTGRALDEGQSLLLCVSPQNPLNSPAVL